MLEHQSIMDQPPGLEQELGIAQESNTKQDVNTEQDASIDEELMMDEDSLWWECESFWSWASSGFGDYTESVVPIGFVELPSESAMDAAGRMPEQPFKDLRAARYAHQRARKYQKRKYIGNKRRRHDMARPGRMDALKDAYAGIKSREWEDDWEAEWAHKIDLEHIDDVLAYIRFGKNADIFERSNGGEEVVHGEDFGSWARRRIHEMRAVKEDRIRQHGKETLPKPLLDVKQHTLRYMWRPDRITTTIPTAPYSKPTETTLPTNPADIDAHATLVYILHPSKFFLDYCRRRKMPPYQHIEGFGWFGEYTWQWHRNMSGCWFLGYGDSCEGGGACPCECPCNGSVTSRCYCKDFGVGTWWEVPALEEQQACSLAEWVRGELRVSMEADERGIQRQLRISEEKEDEVMARADEDVQSWEGSVEGDDYDYEWERDWEDEYVLLEGEGSDASEDWSVVSGVEQRRFADFRDDGNDEESGSHQYLLNVK